MFILLFITCWSLSVLWTTLSKHNEFLFIFCRSSKARSPGNPVTDGLFLLSPEACLSELQIQKVMVSQSLRKTFFNVRWLAFQKVLLWLLIIAERTRGNCPCSFWAPFRPLYLNWANLNLSYWACWALSDLDHVATVWS